MQLEVAPKKTYSAPQLKTLKFEQASLLLVGHAWNGDPYQPVAEPRKIREQ